VLSFGMLLSFVCVNYAVLIDGPCDWYWYIEHVECTMLQWIIQMHLE